MGMPVRLVVYASNDTAARGAAIAAFGRIAALDQMLSDYRPDSELNRLSERAGEWTAVSPELFDVMKRAVEIARLTDGAFDPTIGPLVALWREARQSRRMPESGAIAAARQQVDWRLIELDAPRRAIRLGRRGMRLDLGGIAKGYILQQAVKVLTAQGVTRALLEAGGDILVGDAPPGRAGWEIATPGADAAFAARASCLVTAALATSGSTSQFVEIDGTRYSHIVDPRRGLGVTHHWMARVIATDAATADALATALVVLGPERIAELLRRFPGTFMTVRSAR